MFEKEMSLIPEKEQDSPGTKLPPKVLLASKQHAWTSVNSSLHDSQVQTGTFCKFWLTRLAYNLCRSLYLKPFLMGIN